MHDQRGFTLVEVVVVIAIMGLIFALAAPGLREFTQNSRQATTLNRFVGFLNYARSEAIKRGTTVTVCRSVVGGAVCGAGANWEDGWLVFQDDDGDGVVDAGDALLRHGEALSPTLTMRGNLFVSNRITFTSRGYSNNAGTLRVCDLRGVGSARGVVISRMGRMTRTDVGGVVACP